MATQSYGVLVLLFLLDSIANSKSNEQSNDNSSINRKNFPEEFIFGTASSAYQYEGGANEGGRGPSIWDTFTHINAGAKIGDKSNGDVAADSYHRFKEDVALIRETGFDAYRFSISWTRILKNGKLSGGVNEEGISYYNNLIDELLANGIQPFVTLFHWDLPQALQDEYGGFLSPKISDDFRDYAEICFKKFGDRIKHWITLNEPWSVSIQGYLRGSHAPGHCSDRKICAYGDTGREVYVVSHNQLLAHAAAAHLYKEKYQATQKGTIGISLISHWFKPVTNQEEDQKARDRALDFMLGWFLEPLTKGDYPKSMRSLVVDRLPKFSTEQSDMLKGSFDFIGLNYYTAQPIKAIAKDSEENYFKDSQADIVFSAPLGPKVGSWIQLYPSGLQDLLLHIKTKYNNPLIYITENGVDQSNTLSCKQTLADNIRIDYHYKHLFYLQNAIKDGANVKGYFAWSLLDNFEWNDGYKSRYGIFYVDFQNGLKRYPKDSAHWFKKFLKK